MLLYARYFREAVEKKKRARKSDFKMTADGRIIISEKDAGKDDESDEDNGPYAAGAKSRMDDG